MPRWPHGSAPDPPATRLPAWAPALMYPRQFTHLDGHNAYEVLGVGTWATRSDIELARRRLAGRVHPDLPNGDAARMSLVNAAAAVLLDDAQRDAYDAYLASVSPVRRSIPWPVDRAPSSTRDQHRDPPRGQQRDLHGDGADLDADRNRRPRPTRGRTTGPTRGPTRGATSGATPGSTRRDGGYATEAWGSEPRESGRAQRRRPSPGPSVARTRRIGPMVAPWEDEPAGGPRPALRWRPPPPGPIARWRANRRQARQLARAGRPRRLKAGSAIPVLGLFVMIVAICAIGGAALGYSAASGSSPSPATSPTTPATAPTHPRPSPTGHHE